MATAKRICSVRQTPSVATLWESYSLSLRAEHKSPRTIQTYGEAIHLFCAHLEATGHPGTASAVTRADVEGFVAALLAKWKPATAANRYRALGSFFAWAVGDGELAVSPMASTKPPSVEVTPVDALTMTQLRSLEEACSGTAFEDRRDTALIRLLFDCGLRRAEITGLSTQDVDTQLGEVTVLGKGRRIRRVSMGIKTAKAVDRYLRARSRRDDAAGTTHLWLGLKGPLTENGIRQALERRAAKAGLGHLNLHRLRHTWAHHAKLSGLSDSDLQNQGGWSSPAMVARYGASATGERARQSHRKYSLGDRI